MTSSSTGFRVGHPIVSIIIPTQESAGPLQACLQSLRMHSYFRQEIIIVDGYSRDQTSEVALKEGAQFHLVRGSQASARNVGLAKATGDYVFFMDSDQTLAGDVIQECVELCISKGVQTVKIPEIFSGNTFWGACSAFWRNHVNLVGGKQGGIPRFYEMKCVLEAGLFNENLRLWEDLDLYQRVKASGAKTAWCQSKIYHHEPSSVKTILFKSLRYGRSIPVFKATTSGSSTPFTQITFLTLRSVLQSWRKNPFLTIGCLFLTVLKASATVLGVLQGFCLRIVKFSSGSSSLKRRVLGKMRGKRSLLTVFLLYLMLTLFTLRQVFDDGSLATNDLAPIYKIEQLYRVFDFPWDHWSNLGIPNYFMGNIFYNLPLLLLSWFVGSVVLAHKLFLCLILAFAGFGFFLVFNRLAEITDSRLGGFFAGLGYMLNPWSLNRIFYGHNTILLGFAILPYVFLSYLKSLKRTGIRYLVFGGCLSTVLVLTSLHMAYFAFILIVLYGVFDTFSKGGVFKERLKKQIFSIASLLTLTGVLSFPVLFHVLAIDIPLYVVRGEETTYYASNPSSMGLTDLLYTLMGLLAVGWGTIKLIKERQPALFVFSFLCGIGVFLSFSNLWPIEPLYRGLFQYMPGFFIFVEANRFLFFPTLAISFFLGYLLHTSFWLRGGFLHVSPVTACLTAFKRLLTNNLPVILLLSLMLFSLGSLFIGYLGGSLQPVIIPDHYQALDRWLRSQEGDFRIAFLPPACWATEYTWASTNFIDPVAALPAQPTLELKSERDITLSSSFLRWAYASLYKNKTAYWGKLLGLMGVKYLVMRRDADLPQDRDDLEQFDLENTLTILHNAKDLVLLTEIGPLLIYENPYCLPHLFTTKNLTLVAGDRRSFITLSYLPDFSFSEMPTVFLDNQLNIFDLFPYANSVVLEADRYWDLMLSLVDGASVIETWDHVPLSVDQRAQWIRGDFAWYYYEGEVHNAPDNYVITAGHNRLSLPFTIQQSGLYKVLVQVYKSSNPDFKGMNISIGTDGVEVTLHPQSASPEGAFRWTPIGDYMLDAGAHSLEVTSLGGVAAISKVAVIRNSSLTQLEQDIYSLIQNSGLTIIQIFEDYSWSLGSPKEIAVSSSVNFSNGQALKLSSDGLTTTFHVFKTGEYIPSIRVVNEGTNTLTLNLVIDGFTTPLRINTNSSEGYYQLDPVWLETGRHQIQLACPDNKSHCLVDTFLLQHSDDIKEVSNPPTQSAFVKHSSSQYEIHTEGGQLIFLEANTKYWQMISDGKTIQPLTIFGFANAYPLDATVNSGVYCLEYQGLSHLQQGAVISLCLIASSLSVSYWLMRRRPKFYKHQININRNHNPIVRD